MVHTYRADLPLVLVESALARNLFNLLAGQLAHNKTDVNRVTPQNKDILIQMKEITKRFPGITANDRINFEAVKGEIHALLGENGAGKTTLMNVLYGLYQPDEGEILLRGKEVSVRSPLDAIKLGIGMVHQHFMLVPVFTVAENVLLGLGSTKGLDTKEVVARILGLADRYGLRVDPKARISQLSVGEQQRVEIIKALYRSVEILILDEPTSVLTPQEVEHLFKVLRSMVDEGLTIVFITHKLDEVMIVSDRVTILRDGRAVSTVATNETSKEELAKMMVGRQVLFQLTRAAAQIQNEVLSVQELRALSDTSLPALRGVSFSVHAGEILGVAGVAGNGQTELAETIVRLRKAASGKILFKGTDVTRSSTRSMLVKGVAYIPEDRVGRGLIAGFSVADNLILETYSEPPFAKGPFLNMPTIRELANRLIVDYGIKAQGVDAITRQLSGGNLQKLILAREISRRPDLLIAEQPTRGLDVGATEYVRRRLLEEKQRGAAILLISYDLDEILSLSDRVAVLYEGEIMGDLPIEEVTIEKLGLMMGGTRLGGASQ